MNAGEKLEKDLLRLDTEIERLDAALSSAAWDALEEIARHQIKIRERMVLSPTYSVDDVLRQSVTKGEVAGMKILLAAVHSHLEDLRERRAQVLSAQERLNGSDDAPERALPGLDFDFPGTRFDGAPDWG